MGISGITNALSNSYSHLTSGKKIDKAADGAAELSILEKEQKDIGGYDVGKRNVESAVDALNIADGALANISDSLQRMRELAIQASNGTYSDEDKQSIQDEIEQLKQGIGGIGSQTSYNTKKLLDGSNTSMKVATDGNGSSVSIETGNATLKALGIEDFDVTGKFDIGVLDKAIDNVVGTRGAIGARTNTLSAIAAYNANASYNLTFAKSKMGDLDMPKAISEKKKQETLQTYAMMMQKKKIEQQHNSFNKLFG